ncbi:hypothetical protein [Methanolobus psychrotolerans]|uniref:hypothetical protein n=1 Tax=Methanolobus psychrotolerans TaxID=1874706 RepID=UPI00101AEBB0|nr:hypothetical protein [Methanolobus psychrotolerans]
MSISKQNQTLMVLLEVLKEKSSVFCYNKDSGSAEIIRLLTCEMEKQEFLPVIWIYWNENGQMCSLDVERVTSFHVFRNFTSTLIKIDKMLSKSKHLILLADLTTFKPEQNSQPYIHFISVLLRKNEEYNSTLVTMVNEEEMNPLIRTELIPYFKNEFVLKNKRMKKTNDELIDIKYDTSRNILHLEPYLQNDLNKIREIFSLTPEEKKELDRIVGQSIEEYRTSM